MTIHFYDKETDELKVTLTLSQVPRQGDLVMLGPDALDSFVVFAVHWHVYKDEVEIIVSNW